MGMMAIGVALWKYVMNYAPHSPDFINRDRFVLSNGHTCLFQYTFLHLTGYKAMTFEQLKSYHSSRVDALCPGHPEIEHEGIEVTTGKSDPLTMQLRQFLIAGQALLGKGSQMRLAWQWQPSRSAQATTDQGTRSFQVGSGV